MTTERDLKKEYEERYQEAYREWDGFLEEAKKDLEFYHGDQWSEQEKQYLQWNRRETLAWNKVRRVVKLITGYQRKNRLGFRVDPLEGADVKAASQYTAALLHAMNRCSGFNVMSDAFEGTLKTGINLVEVTVDHSEDPVSGDINLINVPFTRFLFDPNLSKRDLSDCNYLLRREWTTKTEAKALLPGKAKEIDRMKPVQSDLKFDYSRKAQGSEERLRWDEYWRRESEKRTILIDRNTGSWQMWPKDAGNERLELLQQELGDRLAVKDFYQPTVKLAILLEDQVMYDGSDPLEIGEYPFVPVWGDWSPEHGKFREKLSGLIRDIRDPQKELNKRRSKILDIMDSQINSGWYAEIGSVVNEKDLYQSGQGKVIWTQPGAMGKGQLQPIQPAQIPNGFFQMQEQMDQDIKEIPGANNEMFGVTDQKEQQMPGMLAKMRQSQGLTTLQDWFDNYRMSKGLLGDKLLKVIQKSYTPNKVKKVLGEQPAPEFNSREFCKYGVTAEEAPLTDTQRQMAYQERVALKQQGAPIPWAAVMEVAPLQMREELQETVKQEEQKAAQQQQQQQQMDQIRMKAELAKMREDTASAVENRAQAEENRANATYDRAKTMAEMDKLDAEKLHTLSQMLQSMQGSQQQAQEPQQAQRRQSPMTRR